MTKRILLHYGRDISLARPYRLGEAISMVHAFYFKAKELGFEDNHIYIEWPDVKYNVRIGEKYQINRPSDDSILPAYLRMYHELDFDDCDTVIDVNEPNSLYDGCPPYSIGGRKSYIMNNYLNKYLLDSGKYPEMNLQKHHKGFNILMHLRYSYYSNDRDTDFPLVAELIKRLKEKYGNKVNINCTGDIYKDGIKKFIDLELFDNKYPPFIHNINKFFELINESDVIVCPIAGVMDASRMLGIPRIYLKSDFDIENGTVFATKRYWKETIPNKFNDKPHGEHGLVFENPRNMLLMQNDMGCNEMMNFIDKKYESK